MMRARLPSKSDLVTFQHGASLKTVRRSIAGRGMPLAAAFALIGGAGQ